MEHTAIANDIDRVFLHGTGTIPMFGIRNDKEVIVYGYPNVPVTVDVSFFIEDCTELYSYLTNERFERTYQDGGFMFKNIHAPDFIVKHRIYEATTYRIKLNKVINYEIEFNVPDDLVKRLKEAKKVDKLKEFEDSYRTQGYAEHTIAWMIEDNQEDEELFKLVNYENGLAFKFEDCAHRVKEVVISEMIRNELGFNKSGSIREISKLKPGSEEWRKELLEKVRSDPLFLRGFYYRADLVIKILQKEGTFTMKVTSAGFIVITCKTTHATYEYILLGLSK